MEPKDNETQGPGTSPDYAWIAAMVALRRAAQAGLPTTNVREGALETLASVMEWLRLSVGPRSKVEPPPRLIATNEPLVQVWRDRHRRTTPYQICLERKLWLQLGSPRSLALIVTTGGWQIAEMRPSDPRSRFVSHDRFGPYFSCSRDDLHGLREGAYWAELVEQTVVIREMLGRGA
jgi:hypothetical protein